MGLGQVAYGGGGGPSFLGQQMGQSSDFSGKTAALIDEEVKILVERAYRRQGPHAEQHARSARPGRPPAEKENVDGDEFERRLQDMGCEQYLKADEPPSPCPSSSAIMGHPHPLRPRIARKHTGVGSATRGLLLLEC